MAAKMSEPLPLQPVERRPALPSASQWRRFNRFPALLLAAGLASLGITIALPPVPRLIWNASASAPIGLYVVSPGAMLRRGDMVFAWAPPVARNLASRRRYLPHNVPLLKRIVATDDDMVCIRGLVVSVNGQPVVVRRASDRMGRPLPAWNGCIRLGGGQYFLLMTDSPDSFDGRYFGATDRQQVVGKATALWLP